jgi:hypothetical protein
MYLVDRERDVPYELSLVDLEEVIRQDVCCESFDDLGVRLLWDLDRFVY